MQQLKRVDVVIAGGGFVGLTLAKEITGAHAADGRRTRARPALKAGRTRRAELSAVLRGAGA